MPEASWVLFIAASLVLIATPGQDMLLVLSRSVAQGPRAGLITAAGVSIGLAGHTLLVTLGLGAVLRTSEILFTVLKLAGAAYLVYLAVGLLRTRNTGLPVDARSDISAARLFLDGALSNLSNPKVAIFYFAFLPQFVEPGGSRPTYSLLALGLLYAVLAFAVKAPVGLLAGHLSTWLRTKPWVLIWLYRSSGAVLLALGLRLALEHRQ